jgi:hypothetical protein
VLISDGRQNIGDGVAQARLLHEEGVRVDVVAVGAPMTGPEVRIDALHVPATTPAGTRVTATVVISSNVETTGTLGVEVDGVSVEQQIMSFPIGDTARDVVLPDMAPGFHRVHATIRPALDTIAENNVGDAVIDVLGAQHIAVVAGHPGAADNLARALGAAGFVATVLSPSALPDSPDGIALYQSVALVDVPASALGSARMEAIQTAVRDLGVGLTTIGGPDTYGPGGWTGTPLEAVSPVTMQVSNRPNTAPIAVVLVLESVESQQGDSVIRGAARSLVQHLTSRDYVGVTDAIHGLALPLTKLDNKSAVLAAIDRITQFGDPESYGPFLSAAGDALQQHPEAIRHIVVLGDGDAQPTSTALIDQLVTQGVTLSAVGVDIDHVAGQMASMQAIAQRGRGRFYQSEDLSQVPDILLNETQQTQKPWIVETPLNLVVTATSPTLAGLDAAKLPTLAGYVATSTKEGAQTVLRGPLLDPVLAEWQYGLGHVVSWMSDASGRWTAALLSSPQAGKLLANLAAATLPLTTDPSLALSASPRGDQAHVIVSVAGVLQRLSGLTAAVNVVAPDRTAVVVSMVLTAPGRFEGDVPTGQLGTYLLRVALASGGRTVGAVAGGVAIAYSPEYRLAGVDMPTLQQIASAGGGVVLGSAADALGVPLPDVRVSTSLTPALLAIALFVLILDVAARRLGMRPFLLLRARLQAWQRPRAKARIPLPGHVPGTIVEARARTPTRAVLLRRGRTRDGEPAAKPSAPPGATMTHSRDSEGLADAPPEEDRGELAERLLARRRGRR